LIELLINNGVQIFQPVVAGAITWETERKGQPGKLTFSVADSLNFQEGNPISLKVDGVKLFYGFVFKKERDKEKNISVVA
jgi:rRNA maturation protein Rpf1